ncbi:hypothetical protein [Streptomyces sp. SID3343]|uniref:hypothetical protein n=1 Tax=Streptomyces sp. SID3343 TaxID=2690260 RepID=UPI00136EB619|nr:hypothetical protein [Streptomyces sp. SID3343]MYV98858.1 hypothetical protein [Streptomyces sp. SID3343]
MTDHLDDFEPAPGAIHPLVRARAREMHAWIGEFGRRYSLDEDPTEVGPLQAAEFDNATKAIAAKYSEYDRNYKIRHVQAVVSARKAIILLLRRLSGRLSDDAEATLWVELADGGPAVAGPLLVDRITEEHVEPTPAERLLLDDIQTDAAGFASAAEFTIDQDDVEILYYFDNWSERQYEAPIVLDGLDAALSEKAAAIPGVQLIGRAWRSHAQRHSRLDPTWVFVVVIDLASDAPDIRRRLATLRDTGRPFPYPIEVVEEGKDLPFYQTASRARAKRIWPEDPVHKGITSTHWLNMD